MIEFIKGDIIELSPARMILENNGIGYEIHISLTTFDAFRNQPSGLAYIHEIIREDVYLLYGFATRDERELFLLLTSVSGVGPNTARTVLSSVQPSELIQIIATGDEKSLTMIKGIGSKTAQRILVDLKNKVKSVEGKISQVARSERTKIEDEAVAALVMLGFQKAASQKAVETILKKSSETTVEQIIKTALKML
ncbi:MAG: Holliday junction branch migration protein RuvA [Tannerella sp.]|jgi:Holliday junction DNA helicase RuvA|nr:Holliday junction branch migration protein RuvA [Tannerella sp.]